MAQQWTHDLHLRRMLYQLIHQVWLACCERSHTTNCSWTVHDVLAMYKYVYWYWEFCFLFTDTPVYVTNGSHILKFDRDTKQVDIIYYEVGNKCAIFASWFLQIVMGYIFLVGRMSVLARSMVSPSFWIFSPGYYSTLLHQQGHI